MMTFLKDQRILYDDKAHRVIAYPDPDTALLEREDTGERRQVSSYVLLAAWVAGALLVRELTRKRKPPEKKPTSKAYLDEVTNATRQTTVLRMEYIRRLDELQAFQGARSSVALLIQQVAKEIGDRRAPHIATIYRWRRAYIAAMRDVRALVAKFSRRGGVGQGRLHPEVEEILDQRTNYILETQKVWTAKDVWDAVDTEIHSRNALRPPSQHLQTPGFRTVQRRLSQVFAYDVSVARFGKKEADRRFAYRGPSRAVTRILELVEIDVTPVDLFVVDEDGTPRGRPDAVFILDRKSRCVLGFTLSLVGHSTPVIFDAIRHALLPKTYLKDKYPDLDLEWPCYGWFELILMDNGPELVSDAMFDALIALGIPAEMARSRTPNDKAFIERFNRTFNYGFVHKLPGTTLAKYYLRVGFDAEEEAAITLDGLERFLHIWICEKYHKTPHAGLKGKTPLSVWKEGAADFPPQLKANREEVDIEFAELAESAVQAYGIDLNTFVYASPELSLLRACLPARTKVKVKWPRHDAGHIWVWHPHDEDYIRVPNKEIEYVGLTVEQAQYANRRREEDPELLRSGVDASDLLRREVAEMAKDTRMKTQRKRNRLEIKTVSESKPALHEDTVGNGSSVAPQPVPVRPSHASMPGLKIHLPDTELANETA